MYSVYTVWRWRIVNTESNKEHKKARTYDNGDVHDDSFESISRYYDSSRHYSENSDRRLFHKRRKNNKKVYFPVFVSEKEQKKSMWNFFVIIFVPFSL